LLVPTTTAAVTTTATAATATTTTTAATATTTAAMATSSASALTAVSSGASFIDIYSASHQVLAIHFFDSLLRFLLRGYFHESEPPGFTAKSILYNVDRLDMAKNFKSLTQVIFGCLARQISHINIHFGFLFLKLKLIFSSSIRPPSLTALLHSYILTNALSKHFNKDHLSLPANISVLSKVRN
jgi:hypothetical protein